MILNTTPWRGVYFYKTDTDQAQKRYYKNKADHERFVNGIAVNRTKEELR